MSTGAADAAMCHKHWRGFELRSKAGQCGTKAGLLPLEHNGFDGVYDFLMARHTIALIIMISFQKVFYHTQTINFISKRAFCPLQPHWPAVLLQLSARP